MLPDAQIYFMLFLIWLCSFRLFRFWAKWRKFIDFTTIYNILYLYFLFIFICFWTELVLTKCHIIPPSEIGYYWWMWYFEMVIYQFYQLPNEKLPTKTLGKMQANAVFTKVFYKISFKYYDLALLLNAVPQYATILRWDKLSKTSAQE